MALTFCSLASGSSGNCYWVRGGGVELLIDCGISARRIVQALAALGTSIEQITAVVCTHSHDDHTAGAAVLARRYGREIWGTRGTLRLLGRVCERERLRPFVGGTADPPADAIAQRTAVEGLTIESVPTPHDAPGSVALVIRDADTSLGIITDLGVSTSAIVAAARDVDALVLETNHDEEMLRDGPYPEYLKRRILGPYGHLSNGQAGELLRKVAHVGLQQLVLAHLSEHNNAVPLARAAIERALTSTAASPTLTIAPRHCAADPIELLPVIRRRATPQLQLSLPFLSTTTIPRSLPR